jgi:NADH-quinone oxidoreductase subunit J
MIESALFYLFAGLTLGGGLLTITRRSAVIAAVWLTVSLLGVAGLFLLLGSEFLFAAQIIVYVGGITLLFLFVVMLINLEAAAVTAQFRRIWPLGALAGLGLAAELIFASAKSGHIDLPTVAGQMGSEALADTLLSNYAVPFEVTSVLLLVAIVGSVWMGQQRNKS